MAVYRPPIKCPCCGKQLHFKNNPLTELQKLTMWCGNTGGEYEKCDCNLSFPILESTLPDDFELLLNKPT